MIEILKAGLLLTIPFSIFALLWYKIRKLEQSHTTQKEDNAAGAKS